MKVHKYVNDPDELNSRIKELLKENLDIELGYKLSFVSMVLDGAKPKELAEHSPYDVRAIQLWVKTVDEKGVDALKRKKQSGRTPLLSDIQKEEIKCVLSDPNTAQEYGYSLWDGKSVSDFIKRYYSIDISVRRCQELMHVFGLSLKVPQTSPAHPDNPEARENFKKN